MQYQLTIIAASLGELQTVIDRLEPTVITPVAVTQPAGKVEVLPQVAAPVLAAPVATPAPLPEVVADNIHAPAVLAVPAAVFAAPAPIPNVAPAPIVTAAPSPVTAPVAPAASPTPGGAVELDPRGFPWDERIHSSSRARLAKGNFWKMRKNLPDEVVAQVEAELRAQGYGVPQVGGAAAPTTTPAPAPVVAAPVVLAPLPAPAAPSVAPAPVAAAPVAANAPAVRIKELMTAGLAAQTFKAPELMKMIKAMGLEQLNDMAKYAGDFDLAELAVHLTSRFVGLLKSGRINQEWLTQTLAYYGFSDLYTLTGNPSVCPQIKEFLDTNGL